MQWVVMIMYNSMNRGSAAPLALLFTLVSMFFTTAYLKNSFSQQQWKSSDTQSGRLYMLQRQV